MLKAEFGVDAILGGDLKAKFIGNNYDNLEKWQENIVLQITWVLSEHNQ